MHLFCTPTSRQRGFTLVELIVTLVVGSIAVGIMSLFIVQPLEGYTAQTRRAQLTQDAEGALRFMGREIAGALPNSVRTTTNGSIQALELLATLDGARYVDAPLSNAALSLDFTAADGAFSTSVPFTQLTLPWSSSTAYLAIYNIGVPGANAYQMSNVITPAGTTITIAAGGSPNQDLVTLSPAFQFTYPSPGKRVYLVSGPVTYLCSPAAGTLMRYSGYTISSTQPASAAALIAAGASASQVAADVGACQFNFSAGSAQRNALVTLTLQLAQSGESVQLLHQVQLVNTP